MKFISFQMISVVALIFQKEYLDVEFIQTILHVCNVVNSFISVKINVWTYNWINKFPIVIVITKFLAVLLANIIIF